MYCKYCGKQIRDGAKFCSACGRKLTELQSSQGAALTAREKAAPARKGSPKPGLGKTGGIILGVCGGTAAAIILLLVFWMGGGTLGLGQTKALASGTIPASGGMITVSDTGTALDGLEILVPEGAYAQDISFTISSTEITSNTLGDLFNPITPLISVENGGTFADEPMFMTIPIQKTDSEFAMAFGYDQATGELEGIPFAELENDHITILTAHFSDVVVSKVDKTRISGEPDSSFLIDSGFKPGIDDFQMPNMSDAKNYGHCAGQCIAELYYYSKKAQGLIGWDTKLNGRFENNGRGDTPGLFWDDAQAIRLCAQEQKLFKENWTGYVDKTDEDTYFAFAYAIAQTHQPQLCLIHTTSAGHAIIVYGVKGDSLLVADPNFPGQTDRVINYKEKDLKSYFSGANSQEAAEHSTEYTMFGYYGVWKLIDKEAAAVPWLAMTEGEDPGAGYFPQDIPFQVSIGLDESGQSIDKALSDGMTVSAQDLAAIGYGTTLLVSPQDFTSAVQENDTFVFFSGTKTVDSVKMSGPNDVVIGKIPLNKGDNDIGILVMRQGKRGTLIYDGFLNFYRFRVTLTDGQPTAAASDTAPAVSASIVVEPEETTATSGQAVQFAAMAEGMTANPVFVWDFGDDVPTETTEPAASHTYTDPGTYYGTVFLVDGSNKTQPLAQAEFKVTVFGPESSGSAQPSVPAAWTVLLENAGSIGEYRMEVNTPGTPADVGVTQSVTAPQAGQLRVTAQFASSMAGGPRFYGDELGYRAQAIVFVKPEGGETAQQQFSNGYDTEFDTVSLTVNVQAGQTVSIQIVPQGMTCYPETWTPASDGTGYLYTAGQYKLTVEFQ